MGRCHIASFDLALAQLYLSDLSAATTFTVTVLGAQSYALLGQLGRLVMATGVSELRCLTVSMALLVEARRLSVVIWDSWRLLDYWVVYDEVLLVDVIIDVTGSGSSLLVGTALYVFALFVPTDRDRLLIARLALCWNGLPRCRGRFLAGYLLLLLQVGESLSFVDLPDELVICLAHIGL